MALRFMKRLALACTLLAGASLSAQTNTFPTSGNVGIGTTNPDAPLSVSGRIRSGAWQPYGSESNDFFVDVEPSTRILRTRNWNESSPNIAATGIHTGTGWFEGNVGIGGVTNPTTPLVVNGGPQMTAGWNKTSTLQAVFPVQIFNSNGSKWAGIGYDYSTAMRFWVNGTSDDLPGTATTAISILNSGNVGIGTYSPQHKLAVQGNASFADGNTGVLISNDSYQGGRAFLVLDKNAQNGIASGSDYIYLAQENTQGVLVSAQDTPLKLGSGSASTMTLDPSGNVGIGTTNPTHKLAVNGTIKAKEVIVETTGWSDYVFAEDYHLAPLAEVEAHIKTNKRLPGIPSAAQVAESGVNIGDVQAALLAKVEELTLHLIAQEKQIASQKQQFQGEISRLQNRVQELERR
jgi:hypothetical protein